MHIRRMQPQDAHNVAMVVTTAKKDPLLSQDMDKLRGLERLDELALSRIATQAFGGFIAEKDNTIVGIAVYPTRSECLWYVDPAHRNQGYGAQLFEAMHQAVQAKGDRMVIPQSPATTEFLRKQGYMLGHDDSGLQKRLVVLEAPYERLFQGAW